MKRDRIPGQMLLQQAETHLAATYRLYQGSPPLNRALTEDVLLRFATPASGSEGALTVARLAVDFIEQVAQLRNLARY